MEENSGSRRPALSTIGDRWARSARALKKEDQKYGEKIAALAKKASKAPSIGCNDPLEGVVFSVLVELLKEWDRSTETYGDCPPRSSGN